MTLVLSAIFMCAVIVKDDVYTEDKYLDHIQQDDTDTQRQDLNGEENDTDMQNQYLIINRKPDEDNDDKTLDTERTNMPGGEPVHECDHG